MVCIKGAIKTIKPGNFNIKTRTAYSTCFGKIAGAVGRDLVAVWRDADKGWCGDGAPGIALLSRMTILAFFNRLKSVAEAAV